MRLACKHKVNRALWIRKDVDKPRRVVQQKIRAFIYGKATGKSQSQGIFIEYLCGLREVFRRCSPRR